MERVRRVRAPQGPLGRTNMCLHPTSTMWSACGKYSLVLVVKGSGPLPSSLRSEFQSNLQVMGKTKLLIVAVVERSISLVDADQLAVYRILTEGAPFTQQLASDCAGQSRKQILRHTFAKKLPGCEFFSKTAKSRPAV
eukprot:scaffold237_cov421-Prasinococcus_capsulatus_cf.AAC.8